MDFANVPFVFARKKKKKKIARKLGACRYFPDSLCIKNIFHSEIILSLEGSLEELRRQFQGKVFQISV